MPNMCIVIDEACHKIIILILPLIKLKFILAKTTNLSQIICGYIK